MQSGWSKSRLPLELHSCYIILNNSQMRRECSSDFNFKKWTFFSWCIKTFCSQGGSVVFCWLESCSTFKLHRGIEKTRWAYFDYMDTHVKKQLLNKNSFMKLEPFAKSIHTDFHLISHNFVDHVAIWQLYGKNNNFIFQQWCIWYKKQFCCETRAMHLIHQPLFLFCRRKKKCCRSVSNIG